MTLANLLRVPLLARVTLALVAFVCVAVAAGLATRRLRTASLDPVHRDRLSASRRFELASPLVAVALVAAVLGPLVAVLGATQLHGELRGAMCGYGVLDATSTGFTQLGTAFAAAIACGGWLALHAFDRALDEDSAPVALAAATLALVPVLGLDLYAAFRHVLDLDLSVVATCCSSGADGVATSARESDVSSLGFDAAVVAGLLAVGLGVARGGALRARAFAASTLALAGCSLPAAAGVTAPHAFERLGHRCAMCLFEAEGGFVGYPLLLSLVVAAIAGFGTLLLDLQRDGRAEIEAAVVPRLVGLGRIGAAAALGAVLTLAGPVLAYAARTGTLLVPLP